MSSTAGLHGKVAVITGGATGIGLAIAQRFVKEGAYVFIASRRQAELDKAVATLGGEGHATGVATDVSKNAELDRLFGLVRERKGRLDVVVANAAVATGGPLEALTEEAFHATYDINVKGVFFTVQKAAPLLSQGGAVIIVGSVAADRGNAGFSLYSSTKGAIRSFAKSIAVEYKQRKIRVNVLSPGPVETPMLQGAAANGDAGKQLIAKITAQALVGRIGDPTEIANAAYFLASSEGSFVSGAELVVDGGVSAA